MHFFMRNQFNGPLKFITATRQQREKSVACSHAEQMNDKGKEEEEEKGEEKKKTKSTGCQKIKCTFLTFSASSAAKATKANGNGHTNKGEQVPASAHQLLKVHREDAHRDPGTPNRT